MIKPILQQALKEKTLIGIRTNLEDWDEVIIGFLLKLDESFLTINEIDENGYLNGNTILKIDEIISIDYDDRYQKRLKCIYDKHSTFNLNEQNTIWKEGSELIMHFKDLIESKKIVTFYFDEENYALGILLKYDQEFIQIKSIGREGDEDGFSCFHIDKLIGIKYDGIEEQKIKTLFENRASFYK